jgi:DNA-binding SARP family transcriptional activator
LQLNLLPEIRADLADALTGSVEAGRLLRRLYQRQLLITWSGSRGNDFQLHDLLRDFLNQCLTERYSAGEQARLREKAATVLREAGRFDEAIALALQAMAWGLARELILERAGPVLAEGHRATFIDWCARLPPAEMTAWLSYWLGVAHLPDDAAAERWLSRAWTSFEESADRRGQCLAVARVVLVKATSWRTYEGFSAWTRRATALLEEGLPELLAAEDLLVRSGMVRALDFAEDYHRDGPAGQRLVSELLERLAERPVEDPSGLRLPASESLIEHAISTGQADLFAKAVDSVAEDLRDPALSPWVLGNWLVVFGCASGRYFRYSRRGFPYASAEAALRAAIAIGERESLRNIEFGGLYQLQMLMKLRSDFAEFGELITRLAEIADSRFTTQVAVVADCQAALHSREGSFVEAYRDCDRFMAAIEAANEPIIERWPHYITKFQVLLADRRPGEAAALLADLLPRLDGGALARTKLCLLAAAALQAKWSGEAGYADRLRTLLTELAGARWPAILLNLPELLAELLADALDRGIAAEYCRSVIRERRLAPPPWHPAGWPWPLRVHLLGGFRLERDESPIALGAKPPTRALDILRALAVSRDGACSLDTLQDRLWPDLDGDQAKAACEQALHRLRKLLGDADLIVQREGRLRLAADKVFVDLSAWEGRLRLALAAGEGEAATDELERLFFDFPGPLLLNERLAPWLLPVTERVRRVLVDLAIRVGKERERQGEVTEALAIYLRALDFYPDAARLHKSLIEARLQQHDVTGALEDFARYERTMRAADAEPSPAILALVKPLRAIGAMRPSRVSDT